MRLVEQLVTAKEKILKKVRQALTFKSKNQFTNIDLDSNIYVQPSSDLSLIEIFAEQFTNVNGEFIYCSNQFDFKDKLITLLEQRKWKHFFCWEHALQDMLKDTGIIYNHKNEQIEKIQAYNPILHSSLDTIEACGGGSARCMMAEIFLPKN